LNPRFNIFPLVRAPANIRSLILCVRMMAQGRNEAREDCSMR
jgi:hypothetical protein